MSTLARLVAPIIAAAAVLLAGVTPAIAAVAAPRVSVTLPPALALNVAVRATISVTAPGWRPGQVVTLGWRGTGLSGCTDRRVALSSARKASMSCVLYPQAVAKVSVRGIAVPYKSASPPAAASVTTRTVDDGPALSAAAAAARWQAGADQFLTQAMVLRDTYHQAHALSTELRLYAGVHGWDTPHAKELLTRLLALRNPDGGWGIGVAWDAFQDGSVNPADTTYVVTLAGHVGPALLPAWQHGQVSDAILRRTVDLIMTAPLAPARTGRCIGYSTRALDARHCVYNVSSGAAKFLADVAAATGWDVPGLAGRVAAVTANLGERYQPATGYWAYMTATPAAAQDADHNGYTIASAATLNPALAATAARPFLTVPWWRHHTSTAQQYGFGQATAVPVRCSAATSPAVLSGYALAGSGPGTTRSRLINAALMGYDVLEKCGLPARPGARATMG